MFRDWKHLKLAVIENEYGKQADEWNNLYPPVTDDRMLYIRKYNYIVEAVNSLPNTPHSFVCVEVSRLIREECKILDDIKARFSEKNVTE